MDLAASRCHKQTHQDLVARRDAQHLKPRGPEMRRELLCTRGTWECVTKEWEDGWVQYQPGRLERTPSRSFLFRIVIPSIALTESIPSGHPLLIPHCPLPTGGWRIETKEKKEPPPGPWAGPAHWIMMDDVCDVGSCPRKR